MVVRRNDNQLAIHGLYDSRLLQIWYRHSEYPTNQNSAAVLS